MDNEPAASSSFVIGVEARCRDGVCGRLTQLVVDPIKEEVTHVIVEPPHRAGLGRLVPIGSVQTSSDHIDLALSTEEFERLPIAEEIRFLPGLTGYAGIDPSDLLSWPFYGGNTTVPVVGDTLPVGEVAVQRNEEVHATDGTIGRVDGLIVGADHRVSHLVLQEGHLFGHKDVAVPISAVKSVDDDGITLTLSKQEVEELPPVEFHRHG